MTSTKAEPIKRYCKSQQMMCECATEWGYCKFTACANPSSSVNPSSVSMIYANTTTTYKGGDTE